MSVSATEVLANPETTKHRDITYRLERWRAIAGGILEAASGTFLLLIAVKWFQAGATAKALITTGGGGGMLLSPLLVHLVMTKRWNASRASAVVFYIGSACYAIAAIVPNLWVYIAGAVLAQFAVVAAIPLLTQIYQDNYPDSERGKLFSRSVMIRIVAAAAFAQLGGIFLAEHLDRYRILMAVFAVAMGFSAWCVDRIPAKPLAKRNESHPLHAMRYVFSDPVFGRTLLSWWFMGIGNLIMIALRVDYMANPKYGLVLSATTIAFLNAVLPNIARLCLNPLWGFLFDRVNFFLLRIIINTSFMVGILTFFTGNSMIGLAAGAIVFGLSNAGGDLAWSLWVTKVAPPDRVADYMSVHTFFTGVRSVIAPFLAFYASTHLSLAALGYICSGLIIIASLMLIPEVTLHARRPKVAPVTKDFSEDR